MKPTLSQDDRILASLRAARPNPVCATTWGNDFTWRYSACIWRLRHERGMTIGGARCTIHNNHESQGRKSGLFMFWLVFDPEVEKYEQTTWLGAPP